MSKQYNSYTEEFKQTIVAIIQYITIIKIIKLINIKKIIKY